MDNIISYIALLVSIVSFIMSYRLKKNDSERTIKDNLNKIVTSLIDLNSEYNILIGDKTINEEFKNIKSGAILQKISSLSRQATYLVDSKPDIITDSEYATIAVALSYDNQILAKRYWNNAVKKSKNNFYKVINLRAYANFLFDQGTHELSREIYKEALHIFEKNDTDFNKATNGFTHQMWMNSESYHGYKNEADSHYNKAKNLYEQISNSSYKEGNLKSLNQAFRNNKN